MKLSISYIINRGNYHASIGSACNLSSIEITYISYHTAVVIKASNIIYFHYDFEIIVNGSITTRTYLIIVRIKNALYFFTNFFKIFDNFKVYNL